AASGSTGGSWSPDSEPEVRRPRASGRGRACARLRAPNTPRARSRAGARRAPEVSMNLTTSAIAPVNAASLPEYAPTTYIDFTRPEHKAEFEKALADVKAQLGREYWIVIGGEKMKGNGTFESRNPARPSEVIGRFQSGTAAQAAQ